MEEDEVVPGICDEEGWEDTMQCYEEEEEQWAEQLSDEEICEEELAKELCDDFYGCDNQTLNYIKEECKKKLKEKGSS